MNCEKFLYRFYRVSGKWSMEFSRNIKLHLEMITLLHRVSYIVYILRMWAKTWISLGREWEMIKKLFAGNLLSCFGQLHYWAQPSQLCIPKLGWFRFECVRILRTRQNLPITSVHGVYLRYKITFQSCLSFWPGSGI